MTFLRIEVKIELKCNVYNNVVMKEKYCIWCRAERYSLIIVSDLTLF